MRGQADLRLTFMSQSLSLVRSIPLPVLPSFLKTCPDYVDSELIFHRCFQEPDLMHVHLFSDIHVFFSIFYLYV